MRIVYSQCHIQRILSQMKISLKVKGLNVLPLTKLYFISAESSIRKQILHNFNEKNYITQCFLGKEGKSLNLSLNMLNTKTLI